LKPLHFRHLEDSAPIPLVGQSDMSSNIYGLVHFVPTCAMTFLPRSKDGRMGGMLSREIVRDTREMNRTSLNFCTCVYDMGFPTIDP
jgi:hypothetical protein